ncbi:glycosyltransferase [Rothia sp. AR01]|uniref:Glycosyltransferase n=1 Tax=Rothia santali TaxID=2949643 RepID=A0A9X2KI94_9MICC|nr:glycosyltransferase family 2 protein [Rothia santali]MCP3425634.1 glycosyltransferase [Rothia santali]
MSTPRTSIVMPVYNTAARVVGAIRSVLAQTDPDFELLVMIDGSPDESSAVVADFVAAEGDERIRVFDNPRNQGVSAVRNQALDAARGRWISFIDSDDRYRPNFLSTLHAFAEAHEADVVACGHTLVHATGENRDRFRTPAGVYTGEQAVLGLLADRFTPYVWDKLVRASLLDDVRFPEDIHRAEDAVTCMAAYARARRAVVVATSLYEYTVDPGSLTWGKVTPVEQSDRLMDHLRQAAGKTVTTPSGRRAYDVSWVLTYLNNAQQALFSGREEGAGVIRACRRRIEWAQVLRAMRARPVFGAAGFLLKTSPALYRTLYGAYVKRSYGL